MLPTRSQENRLLAEFWIVFPYTDSRFWLGGETQNDRHHKMVYLCIHIHIHMYVYTRVSFCVILFLNFKFKALVWMSSSKFSFECIYILCHVKDSQTVYCTNTKWQLFKWRSQIKGREKKQRFCTFKINIFVYMTVKKMNAYMFIF